MRAISTDPESVVLFMIAVLAGMARSYRYFDDKFCHLQERAMRAISTGPKSVAPFMIAALARMARSYRHFDDERCHL